MRWQKKLDSEARKSPRSIHYKGLTFPLYQGLLSHEQAVEEAYAGKVFYAYYGGKPLTETEIIESVDVMIERGLYAA